MRAPITIVVCGLLLAGCSGNEAPTQTLSPQAVAVMQSAPYKGSTWAIHVVDATTGEVLVDENSDALLGPASVTKTYSVGAAWLRFGPDSRITTPVVRNGEVSAGTLNGDLILVAKGDVLMGGQTGEDGRVVFTDVDHNDANAVPGATISDNDPLAGLDDLAEQIKSSGINRVTGDVIVDDRLWVTQDLGNDGPVSPIVINNNLIDVVAEPREVGQPARVSMRPEVAPWRVINRVRTAAAGQESALELISPSYGVIVARGTVAADADPQLRVEHFTDPPRFARTALIEALERAGVSVTADATAPNPTDQLPSRRQVDDLPKEAVLTGLPLEQNATYILKVSYNRGAQTQICLLAAAAGSRNCDTGMPEMGQELADAGVDPLDAALLDGTGSPGNYVTAKSITQLMRVFNDRPDGQAWQDALPIMGVDGSLASVQTDSPAKGHVYAKTGTNANVDLMNNRLRLETKALGGYIVAKSGRKLAIAIIVNEAMFQDIEGLFAANEDLGKIATSIYEAY